MASYDAPSWEKVYAFGMEIGKLKQDVYQSNNYFQKLSAIARYWKNHEQDILEHSRTNPCRWYTSYPIDWSLIQTPVEQDAWISIRRKGQIVLYPQYPVLNYHVDFGNPFFKIALEIDGKDYHKDKQKDHLRDQELKANGWTVFRVTGSEMWRNDYKDFNDIDREEWRDEYYREISDWIMKTGDGVIEAIRQFYFLKSIDRIADYSLLSLCESSLYEHCTTR